MCSSDLYLQGSLPTLQRYYLQGRLSSVCVCDLGPTFTPTVQFCPIKLSTVTYIHLYTYNTYVHIHTFIHIHSHIHTNHTYIYAHACTYSCIYTFMHIHTYICHLYAIALTTLSLDSTKSKKRNKTKRQNVIPSVSNPKISPSIHFK